jgi:hypothetical protein
MLAPSHVIDILEAEGFEARVDNDAGVLRVIAPSGAEMYRVRSQTT